MRHLKARQAGFTLIEVVVALAICGWVLGSAFWVVDNYASQRLELRDRFYAQQVGWNHLLERYQQRQGWGENQQLSNRDSNTAGGQSWLWTLQAEPTVGAQLIRFEVRVSAEGIDKVAAAPVLYLGGAQ